MLKMGNINHIIKETIDKFLIKEAALPSFSLETLDNIKSYRGKMKYCKENLGPCQGRGSSRAIFQIDDNKILKLAMNTKGIAQNEEEGQEDWYKENLDIFPKVYERAEDYSWLVTEFVLPARAQDFKQCFGISMKDFFNFIYTLGVWYRPNGKCGWGTKLDYDTVQNLVDNNEFLYNYSDFIGNYTQYPIGDMLVKGNYGMTLRNGQPTIVLLDSGLTYDVWNNYYDRKRQK